MLAQMLTLVQPLPRTGIPDDIAAMALFLASDEARFVTGAAMVVDGGFSAGGSLLPAAGPMPTEYAGPSFEEKT